MEELYDIITMYTQEIEKAKHDREVEIAEARARCRERVGNAKTKIKLAQRKLRFLEKMKEEEYGKDYTKYLENEKVVN